MIRQQAKITNRGNVQNQEEYMQSKRKAQNAEQSAVRFKKYLSKDNLFFASVHHHSEFEMKHGAIELQTFRTIFICRPTFQRLRMDKIPLESVTV